MDEALSQQLGAFSAEPFTPGSVDRFIPPDAFVQMPPTQTKTVQKLRYMTDPLPDDVLVAGPISLTLYAAIDHDDTNWFAILKDVGPDVSVMSVREGEREPPADLPEREVTRGWLKALLRATDPKRSKPGKPWHLLTRESRKPVVPGDVNEYQIEIMATANLFRKAHRICLEIASVDFPTGVAGATNAEYVPYHIGQQQDRPAQGLSRRRSALASLAASGSHSPSAGSTLKVSRETWAMISSPQPR